MAHNCVLHKEEDELDKVNRFVKIRLISPVNPRRLTYFKSDVSIREEQRRHLKINKFAIHPFSKFMLWYEVYLIFLYGSALCVKPLNAGFIRKTTLENQPFYRWYNVVIDFLSVIDIVVNFVTGYCYENTKDIELRSGAIVMHYVFRPFFICDLTSSVPTTLLDFFDCARNSEYVYGLFNILSLLKIVRSVTLLKCVSRSAEYSRIISKGFLSLGCSILVTLLIVHWMACLHFAIPRFVRRVFVKPKQNNSWFIKQKIYNQTIWVQYCHSFFKSSANILCIRLNLYKDKLPEEIALSIFTYFLGKILIAFIWIILAVAILNARSMDIKFAEIVNQLDEYMRQKQLPLNLRGRILQYFNFKYQRKYFKEDLISSILSESLKKDVNMHVCKSLIRNVTLFNDLSPLEITKVVEYLIPEIFMPNDIIIQSGSHGDAMYFLSSGTVAVYTRSGREICHMQDGAYFGEISMVLKDQTRTVTIVAIETSHVYRLTKRNLEKCLLSNKSVMAKIMKNAELRLKEASKVEEDYKKVLFEQTYQKSADT